MSRGKLDKETGNKIGALLPDVMEVRKATLHFQPDFISMGFPPGSTIPIAAVCLQEIIQYYIQLLNEKAKPSLVIWAQS